MDGQRQPLTGNDVVRTLRAWQIVRRWPGLGPAVKLIWYTIWFDLAGGRPGEVMLTAANVVPEKADARSGRDAIPLLIDMGLLQCLIAADPKSRRPGANVWKVYVNDPADVQAEHLKRFDDPQPTLFDLAADDLSVGGDHAALDGSREAVTNDSDDHVAAAIVPFKPRHDASYSSPAPASPSDAPAAAAGCGPRPASAARPPTGAAEFARTPPHLGLMTSRDNLSRPKTSLVNSPSPNRSGAQKVPGDDGRANFAAPPTDEPQSLGSALLDSIMARGAERKLTPAERAGEVQRWAVIIRDQVSDRRLDEAIVTRVAEAAADGMLPEKKLRRVFDSLHRQVRLQTLQGPRFGYFVSAAKRAFSECGLEWRTKLK